MASFWTESSEAPSEARPISWENWAKLGSASSGTWPNSSWHVSLRTRWLISLCLRQQHISGRQCAVLTAQGCIRGRSCAGHTECSGKPGRPNRRGSLAGTGTRPQVWWWIRFALKGHFYITFVKNKTNNDKWQYMVRTYLWGSVRRPPAVGCCPLDIRSIWRAAAGSSSTPCRREWGRVCWAPCTQHPKSSPLLQWTQSEESGPHWNKTKNV